MFIVRSLLRLVAILVALVAGPAAVADTLVAIASPAAQRATDMIHWNTLGPDQTVLPATFSVTSTGGVKDSVALTGPNSVLSLVCATTPANCSWTGSTVGFAVHDTLLWTSDAGNLGNGPVTLTFAKPVAGTGAFIQADLPGQFTARLDLYNNATLLGTFSVASDAKGDAVYIGAMDTTAASITSAKFSLTACAALCTDFAVDTVYVTSASVASTTTTLTSSANPAHFGGSVTFTATVTSTAGTPTGTVTFKDGATTLGMGTLSAGKATFATSKLAVGSHSITASYARAVDFAASTSAVLTETISTATTSTTLTSSANPAHFGSSVTFTATVTSTAGTPTGTVTFKDGATTLGTGTLSAGKATFATSKLAVGSHSITASYAGAVDFAASTSATLVEVIQ